MRESFPYKRPVRQHQLFDKIKSGAKFGHSQCDIKVPEHLREKFANLPPICKNKNEGRHDIGPILQESSERKGLLSQTRRMLNSSFEMINGTVFTPLLLFYLDVGLVGRKHYRFLEYTLVKCFNNSVQSAVNARRQTDENPNSSVVAKTMKLIANSSYGLYIMDRTRNSITKYTSDEKTQAAINIKMFERLGYINDQMYKVELAKS